MYEATRDVKIGKLWRGYLFDTISTVLIDREPVDHLKRCEFSNVSNEEDFKFSFFKVMHLLKAKATLSDYLDLNRRYIKTTDIIIFEDDMVKFDVIPKQFFNSIIDNLYQCAYEESNLLFDDCNIEDINPALVINENDIIDGINAEFDVQVSTLTDAYRIVKS